MAEVLTSGNVRGVSWWEWRLQAVVAACNAVPVVLAAMLLAFVGFIALAATGGVSLFLGAVGAVMALGYAWFCVVIARGFWRRKRWPLYAAIPVLLLHIALYVWAVNTPTSTLPRKPAYLYAQPVEDTRPASTKAIAKAIGMGFDLFPWVNAMAVAHLLLRWRRFSQSE